MQIPPPIIPPSPSATAQAATAPIAPVEVAVSSTPANITQLLRQISITGTVAAPPDASNVTLTTALGNFSFSLAQLPDVVKAQLTLQLMSLFDSQKQMTAVVQPGTPPTQAVLLLPNATSGSSGSAATVAPQQGNAQTQPLPQPLTLSPGAVLPAVVLPPDIVVPGALAEIPAASTQATPQTPNTQANPQTPTTTQQAAQTAQPQTQSAVTSTSTVAATPISPNNQTTGTVQITATTPAINPNQQAPAQSATPSTQAPSSAPTISPAQTSTIPSPTATAPAQASAAAPQPVTPNLQSLLQPGKEVMVTVDAVASPSSPLPPVSAPNQTTATVIGNGANGQLIVKAGDATLYVRTNVEAPVGTTLLVSLDAPKAANPAVLPPIDQPNFSSLQQVMNALADANPQMAQQFAATHIPQPAAELAGPLLLFLNALKKGDMKSWLGEEAAETLSKAGKLGLISKFAGDMDAATQTMRDANIGEWKSYPLPLMNNGQFQSAMLHVHADGRGAASAAGSDAAAKNVRFLIDMRMSRLGPMQLDGLVRPNKLDMIVRSESALPAGLPQDLRQSYIKTLEAAGFAGSLSFQIGHQNWIVPYNIKPKNLVT